MNGGYTGEEPEFPMSIEDPAAHASALDRGDVLPLRSMLERRERSHSELAGAEATVAREAVRQRLFDQSSPAQKIDRYSVIRRIGRGAMGTVYLAYDGHLDRKVALKLIRRGVDEASDELLEARAMARIDHPAVVGIFDVGRFDRWLFLAMEYAGGPSVREWLSEARRDWREVVRHFVRVGDGLAAAHRAGMVHRDVKLDNMRFSTAGTLRLLDFGLARFAKQVVGPQRRAAGTLQYMAPEVLAGHAPDASADQFAFCVSVWEALSGERPFRGRTVAELRALHRTPPPELRLSGLGSRRLRACLRRGLAIDPLSRFRDMDHLVAELDACVRARSRIRRNVAVGSLLGGSILATSFIATRDDTAACEEASTLEQSLWAPAERSAVAQTFTRDDSASSTRGRAVVASLDDYAHTWAERMHANCEAHGGVAGPEPKESLQFQTSCLQRSRAGFRALVGALAELDSDGARKLLMRSGDVTGALPAPDECLDARLGMLAGVPAPASQRAQVERVRTDLTLAEVHRRLGDLELAETLSADALVEADAIAHAPLQASGHLARGLLLSDTGDIEASESHLRTALGHALRGQDNPTAAKAAEQLAHIVGYELARPSEGEHWLWVSEQIRLGLPEQDRDTAALNSIRAAIHVRAGNYDDAVIAYTQAIAATRHNNEMLGENSSTDPLLATLHNNLGSALSLLGREERARPHFATALEIRLRALGDEHPLVGSALRNLGTAELEAGELSSAVEHLEQALAIQERAYGRDSVRTVYTLTSLSRLRCREGAFPAGVAFATRALDLQRRHLGADHPVTGECLATLADCEIGAGQLEEARDTLRSLQQVTAAHPDDWHLSVRALGVHANILLEEEDFTEAAELYEEVAARWRTQGRADAAADAHAEAARARGRLTAP